MQRAIVLLVALLGLGCWVPTVWSQGNNAAAARMEELEVEVKRMAARISDLEEAQQTYKRNTAIKLNEMSETLRSLREELSRSSSSRDVAALKETTEALRRSIEKVDENRVNDSKRVQSTLRDIAETLAKRPVPTHVPVVTPPEKKDPTPPPPKDPDKRDNHETPAGDQQQGFEYTVQKADSLSGIVGKARASGILVTRKQVIEANPTVNWDRLRVGQKIFVPRPAK